MSNIFDQASEVVAQTTRTQDLETYRKAFDVFDFDLMEPILIRAQFDEELNKGIIAIHDEAIEKDGTPLWTDEDRERVEKIIAPFLKKRDGEMEAEEEKPLDQIMVGIVGDPDSILYRSSWWADGYTSEEGLQKLCESHLKMRVQIVVNGLGMVFKYLVDTVDIVDGVVWTASVFDKLLFVPLQSRGQYDQDDEDEE